MDFGKLFSKVVKTVKDSIEAEQRQTTTAQPKPTPQPAVTTHYEEKQRTDSEWVTYFREILATEFPQYNIKENIAVTEVAGFATDEFKLYKSRPTQAYKAEWGQPYTFVLEQAGNIKGVIMLGKGHSHDSNVKYLISRMYTKKLGIPYINFYTQMPNERDYVIGRIRKFLN
jgi:hypothetical protein